MACGTRQQRAERRRAEGGRAHCSLLRTLHIARSASSSARQRRSQPQAASQAAQCTAQPAQGPLAATRVEQGSSSAVSSGDGAIALVPPLPPPLQVCVLPAMGGVTLSPSLHPPAACCSAPARTSSPCSWWQPACAPACARPPTSSGHAGRQAAAQGGPGPRPAGGLLSLPLSYFTSSLHQALLKKLFVLLAGPGAQSQQ